MAGIVTAHGNVIAWDCGMVKIISDPVMKRLEPHSLPIFESVMPDASITMLVATSANSIPKHSAPSSVVSPSGVVPEALSFVTYGEWKAADGRKQIGKQSPGDEDALSRALSSGVSISLPVFSATTPPTSVPSATTPLCDSPK